MLEQDVIERRAFDLDGFGFAIEFSLAENEARAERAIAEFKLRSELADERAVPQFFQHAHVAENGHVAGQERFTDVEAREKFFFEDEHAFARAREKSGGTAAAGAATNHECVINVLVHATSLGK